MTIAFIDQAPTVEEKHGHFLMTMDSGGEAITLMFTRNALLHLTHRCAAAHRNAFERDAKVVPFGQAKRKRACTARSSS